MLMICLSIKGFNNTVVLESVCFAMENFFPKILFQIDFHQFSVCVKPEFICNRNHALHMWHIFYDMTALIFNLSSIANYCYGCIRIPTGF